jgi:hypothetical protein
LEVKVLCTPGKGKCYLNGKGVHREMESARSCKQNAGLTNRKRIEAAQRVSRPIEAKPDSCTERCDVDPTGMGRKVGA